MPRARAALQSARGAPPRRLLDNSGSEGAERARGLVTSPGGTSQHAGYDAHLNRTEFSDLARARAAFKKCIPQA
jgi:hypothetical protein